MSFDLTQITNNFDPTKIDWTNTASTGMLAGLIAFIAGMFLLAMIMLIGLYIYNSLVWQTIAKKLNHKYPWLAWIPLVNISLLLQLGNFHWAWVFLILIPVLGWIALGVMMLIACWRVFEKRNFPGWLALVPLAGCIPFLGMIAGIGFLVILGYVAWGKK